MKKGFTLFELLAVIVIIAVISLITYSVVQKNIDVTKKSSFEVSVKNMIEAAKEYVVTNYEESDFPEGGIDIANNELDIKNSEFISGIIKKNEEGQIEVVNLTDGYMCANGTKNDLVVTNGSCESADKTPPTLEVKVLKKTANKVRLLVKMQDAQSGLKELRYSYANREDTVVDLPDKRSMVKKIIEIDNLDSGNTYEFKFTVKNNFPEDDDKITTTTKEIEVKIPEVEEPLFRISSGTYATTKVLTIIYPDVEGYEYSYQKGNEEEVLVESGKNETSFEIEQNTLVNAYIRKNGEEVISSKLMVTGLDVTPPTTKVYIEGLRDWSLSKDVYVQSTDDGAGIALRAYSLNNKKSWKKLKNDSGLLTVLDANQRFTLKTRDKVGNIQEKFRLCYDASFTNCDSEDVEFVDIQHIDNIGPKIEITVLRKPNDKVSEDNEWYISNVVTVQVKIYDQTPYFENEEKKFIPGGIGINKYEPVIRINNKNMSFDNTRNANGEFITTFDLPENGVYEIEAAMKDDFDNSSTESVTIKKDDVNPTIVIPNIYTCANEEVSESKENTTVQVIHSCPTNSRPTEEILEITHGVSGYKVDCNPEVLSLHLRKNVSCTITGGNGLTASDSTSTGYYYYATQVYRETRSCSKVCTRERSGYCCYDDKWCGSCGCDHYENRCTTSRKFLNYSCDKGGTLDGTKCYF